MKKYLKNWPVFLTGLVAFSLGIILIVSSDTIINIVSYVLGVIFILIGLKALYFAIKTKNKKIMTTKYLEAIVDILLGIIIFVIKEETLHIYLALVFVIMPIIRLILAKDKAAQAISDIFYYIFGLIILICGTDFIIALASPFLGVVLIVISFMIIYIGYFVSINNKNPMFYQNQKNDENKSDDSERIVIDSTDHKEL